MDTLQQHFNGVEQISPLHGYPERSVFWFYNHILPDFRNYIPADARLVDVGCAYGYFTRCYAEYVQHACGVDFAPERIRKARMYNWRENVAYDCLDITRERLHYRATAAISSALFQHLPPDLRRVAFANVRQALPAGATLLLYDTLRDQEAWDGFFGALTPTSLARDTAGLFAVQTTVRITHGEQGEPVFRIRLAAV